MNIEEEFYTLKENKKRSKLLKKLNKIRNKAFRRHWNVERCTKCKKSLKKGYVLRSKEVILCKSCAGY